MSRTPIRSPSCAAPSSGAARALRDGEPTEPEPTLDRPPKPELGDYSSNAAMLLAGAAGRKPARRRRAPAGRARARARRRRQPRADRGRRPRLRQPLPRRRLVPARDGAPASRPARTSARRRPRRPERILVEFVSANPTGPLHVGGGRHAAYGDALVRLLEAVGHEVEREYYVNDAGGQIERFADSIAARMTGERAARGRLRGRVRRRAGRADRRRGDRPRRPRGGRPARRRADPRAACAATLERFGVRFDTWFSERDLYSRGEVEAALAELEQARPHLPQRGRALAAHHRLRRRQGPGADPRQRRADLPRRRRRLPLGQAASAASTG